MVARIFRGGPAHRAGIRAGSRRVEIGNAIVIIGGDILVEIDGEQFENSQDFHRIMKSHKPGDQIEITLWRGNKKLRVGATLGERAQRHRR